MCEQSRLYINNLNHARAKWSEVDTIKMVQAGQDVATNGTLTGEIDANLDEAHSKTDIKPCAADISAALDLVIRKFNLHRFKTGHARSAMCRTSVSTNPA